MNRTLDAPPAGATPPPGGVPPYRAGLEISPRHFTDPRRAGVSALARIFEITVHQWANVHVGDTLIRRAQLADAARTNPAMATLGDLDALAGELEAAGLWAGMPDGETWSIATPTIRYYHTEGGRS